MWRTETVLAKYGYSFAMHIVRIQRGAALTVYIIISEGSRIVFPPRNLVPVP